MMDLYDGERVTDVKGFAGIYAVTDQGRVWSYRRNKWLAPSITDNGYRSVILCFRGKEVGKTIHRLVGEAFVKNPHNKPQINHKNGDRLDNNASNLEWVTARENLQHACDLGLNSHYKLTLKNKIIVCKMYYLGGIRKTDIARIFDMSPAGILYILRKYGDQVGHA